METLLEIKNTYAKEQGYEDWHQFVNKKLRYGYEMEEAMDEICIRAQKAYYIDQITELISDLKGVHAEYILERLKQEIEPYEI